MPILRISSVATRESTRCLRSKRSSCDHRARSRRGQGRIRSWRWLFRLVRKGEFLGSTRTLASPLRTERLVQVSRGAPRPAFRPSGTGPGRAAATILRSVEPESVLRGISRAAPVQSAGYVVAAWCGLDRAATGRCEGRAASVLVLPRSGRVRADARRLRHGTGRSGQGTHGVAGGRRLARGRRLGPRPAFKEVTRK